MIQGAARRLWLAGLWMLFGSACVADFPPAELGSSGSARVVFVVPRSVPGETVARATVTASGEGVSASEGLAGSDGVWQGLLHSIPSGQRYTFQVEAFDGAGTRRFEVAVEGEPLEPHRPGLIILVGQEPGVLAPSGNRAPSIEAVVGSRVSVQPGGTIRLRAQARDTEAGEALAYTWQSDEGTFDDANAVSPTWTAPETNGPRTVTLVVRDSQGGATSLSFGLDVASVGSLSDARTVSFNRWPKAADLVVLPSKDVGVGQEVTLELRGTDDEDADTLTYTWSATCKGTQVDGTGSTVRFTPSELPSSSTCDNCVMQVRVEDGHGGSTEYEQGLCVKIRMPPSIDGHSPTTLTARPGDVLRFDVSATDPSGGALTFSWAQSTGLLAAPVQTGNTSEVRWTALSCIPAGVKPTIDVTVSNTIGLSSIVRYEVTWDGPVCGHPPCAARFEQNLISLEDNCITDTPVFIPEGLTIDGGARTLTAVDPQGGEFTGAIVRNRGEIANVRNLKVKAERILSSGPCPGGDARLWGIRLLNASGSVEDNEVTNIRRNKRVVDNPDGEPWGCQEGFGIEVRNLDKDVAREVSIVRNTVSGYQKTGIIVSGRVDASVANNRLTGAGPVGHIAQNGIQFSNGATGRVTDNEISSHSYTGADTATGILVAGGPLYNMELVLDAVIQGNTLTGNDIGISLSQGEKDYSGSKTPTRIQVIDNILRNDGVTNGYVYQAGISDIGNGNTIRSNSITGIGYDPATQPGSTFDVDVTAGAASVVVFLSSPVTVPAGACSSQVVVQAQDAKGNMKKPASASFALTASGAAAQGLTFHTSPDCAGPGVTTVPISSQAEGIFYFKAPQPGTVTLTASSGSLSGSQNQTVSGS